MSEKEAPGMESKLLKLGALTAWESVDKGQVEDVNTDDRSQNQPELEVRFYICI